MNWMAVFAVFAIMLGTFAWIVVGAWLDDALFEGAFVIWVLATLAVLVGLIVP